MFTPSGFFDRLDDHVDLIGAIFGEIGGSARVDENDTLDLPGLRSVGHIHSSHEPSAVRSHIHHRLPDIGL